MNYVITGSLGHISKPVIEHLVASGHHVTVVTSNEANKEKIESLGANAAVGSVEDGDFVTATFAGANAVYLMIPPNPAAPDFYAYQQKVADNYVHAVAKNNIKYVVQLSSIGAHLRKGTGPVDGLGYLEEKLGALTESNVLMLRPSYFFYNLFGQIGLVKNAGIFGANYGGDEKLVLVDTNDIAAVVIEALSNVGFEGHTIKYIASDERTTDEIAMILSEAIGKPSTPWVVFSDEQNIQGLVSAGFPQTLAESYTEMGKSIKEGRMQEDYWKNRPATFGKMKLEEFAKSFAVAYNN